MKIEIDGLLGIEVELDRNIDSPTPYGLKYYAKGFYIQKNHIIIVGLLNSRKEEINTVRLKYKKREVLTITPIG